LILVYDIEVITRVEFVSKLGMYLLDKPQACQYCN
jgi:hypothetical protein